MADWLFWLQFAARILQLLQEIFGADARILLKVEDLVVKKIDDSLVAPGTPSAAELKKDSPKKA